MYNVTNSLTSEPLQFEIIWETVDVPEVHFCCPLSLFQGHVAGRNLMCQC